MFHVILLYLFNKQYGNVEEFETNAYKYMLIFEDFASERVNTRRKSLRSNSKQ